MKKRVVIISLICIVIILQVSMVSMLAGCFEFSNSIKCSQDTSINNYRQSTYDNSYMIDNTIIQQNSATAEPVEIPDESVTPVISSALFVGEHENQTSNSVISLERAIEIAYADLKTRGIDAAYRSNSGVEWEKGQWVWELLFRTTGERMPFIEYYINTESGNIVKFEWDD